MTSPELLRPILASASLLNTSLYLQFVHNWHGATISSQILSTPCWVIKCFWCCTSQWCTPSLSFSHTPVSASLILSSLYITIEPECSLLSIACALSNILSVIGLILPQSKSLMQTKSLLSLPDRKHITQTDKIIWQSLIHFDIKVIIQQHVHICLYTRYIYKGIAIRRTSQMCVYVCTCGCMHSCEHMYVHVHICISYGYLSMHIIWILKYCINECL